MNTARKLLILLGEQSYSQYVANVLQPTLWLRLNETSGSIAKNAAYSGGVGAELFTNPGIVNGVGSVYTFTADDPDGYVVNGEVGTDPEISEVGTGEGHGGAGSGLVNIFSSSGLVTYQQNSILTVGDTYRSIVDVDTVTAGSIIRTKSTTANIGSIISIAGLDSYDYIADDAGLGLKRGVAGTDVTLNGHSVKKIGELDAANTAATVAQTGALGANEAYDLDGATSLLTVTNKASIQGLTTFTLMVLHKPDTAGEVNAGTFSFKTSELIFRLASQDYFARAEHSTTNAVKQTNDAPVTFGEWQTSVMRLNSDKSLDVFHNGVKLSSFVTNTTGVGTRASTTNNLVIGNEPGATQTYDGLMDELILVDSALTDAQIQQWHNLTGV